MKLLGCHISAGRRSLDEMSFEREEKSNAEVKSGNGEAEDNCDIFLRSLPMVYLQGCMSWI